MAQRGTRSTKQFSAKFPLARFYGGFACDGIELDSADDRPNGPSSVIISESLWRRRFNAESEIVGRQITLNSNNFSVIGVVPRAFENVIAPRGRGLDAAAIRRLPSQLRKQRVGAGICK